MQATNTEYLPPAYPGDVLDQSFTGFFAIGYMNDRGLYSPG
jgi:hypothetical protein